MTITVTVKPRSKKQGLIETVPGFFEARVVRPPFQGQANAELIALLAKHFGIAKSRIVVVAGGSNRKKIVEIH